MKHATGTFYTTDKPSDIGRVYASDGELVATVHQTKDKRIYENTALFAAAPELLEGCKNLLWHFAPDTQIGHATIRTDELRKYAEAAIAKADALKAKGGE